MSADDSFAGEGRTAHLDRQIYRLEAELRSTKAAHAETTQRLGEANRLLNAERSAGAEQLTAFIALQTENERLRLVIKGMEGGFIATLEWLADHDLARLSGAAAALPQRFLSLKEDFAQTKAALVVAQAEATEWRARANRLLNGTVESVVGGPPPETPSVVHEKEIDRLREQLKAAASRETTAWNAALEHAAEVATRVCFNSEIPGFEEHYLAVAKRIAAAIRYGRRGGP